MAIDYDFSVKYDGKGYAFKVYVNSNEPPEEIAKRLQKAARGQIKAACMVACSKLTPKQVETFMGMLAKAATGAKITEFTFEDD